MGAAAVDENACAVARAAHGHALGALVEVAARTSPGFNLPGGTARISAIHDDGNKYDVKYVLGGSEKRVDACYIRSKVLATRQELGEQRQEDQARRRKAKKDEDAQRLRLEAERLERKRRARAELAKRREQKHRQVTRKNDRPAKKKHKTTARQADAAAPQEAPQADAAPHPDMMWLRDFLINKVPRAHDADDEVDVQDLLAALETNDVPSSLAKREAVLGILAQLEGNNLVMCVDSTIFLV